MEHDDEGSVGSGEGRSGARYRSRTATTHRTVLIDPPVTDTLLAELVDLWVWVTNAGGAVGFLPPTTAAEIRPTARATLARVADGTATLVALREADRIVAWCVLEESPSALRRHWRTVVRVQVAPDRQGAGLGDHLMQAAADVARDELKLSALFLSVRGGTGIERFYRRLGYREMGRLPGAIRVGPDDDREEILMWRAL